MQAKQFKNFSTEDFTWKFDGISYTFAAGQTIFLEDFKADHFAKHLVDREMNKLDIITNMPLERARLTALCFPSDEVVTPLEALQINKGETAQVEEEEEFPDLEEEVVVPKKLKDKK